MMAVMTKDGIHIPDKDAANDCTDKHTEAVGFEATCARLVYHRCFR
jgi:hypothetical protein